MNPSKNPCSQHAKKPLDYYTENHVAYYQHLADAFGASDKMLEFLYIDQAQAYQFDVGRYAGMQYGWDLRQGFARLSITGGIGLLQRPTSS